MACAFHSPVVAAASERFAAVLAGRPMAAPQLPVWSNRTAAPYPADPESIRAELAAQISAPVRFADQVEAMYAAGARVFVEAGPGTVLTGLVRAVLGGRPHVAVPCDPAATDGLRRFLISLGELGCAGVPLDLSWLFQDRAATGSAGLGRDGRPRWMVDGQLIRDSQGNCPPGGLAPARVIKEFAVSSAHTPAGQPADLESMLAEYLRSSREVVSAQRDVMLAFLGGAPGGRLTWQPDPAAAPVNGAASRPAVLVVPEPAGVATAAPATAAQPAAPQAPAAAPVSIDQDALIALISERTGYPVDLIEPDLDLEAELSIDSIKRAEIAGEVAASLGMSAESDQDAARFEELVKLRTVRSIVAWLHEMAAADGQDAAASDTTGGTPASDTTAARRPRHHGGTPPPPLRSSPAAAETAPGQAALTGVTPLRLVPQPATAPRAEEPPASLSGARFLLTGAGEVSDQLAARLRECGAEAARDHAAGGRGRRRPQRRRAGPARRPGPGRRRAATRAVPAGPHGAIGRPAEGRPTPAARPAASPRWLLAAGTAGSFGRRRAGRPVPGHSHRIPGSPRPLRAAGPGGARGQTAARLLGELLSTDGEPVVSYAQGVRQRTELVPVPLSALARRGAGPAADGMAEAQALGLSSDSVVVMIGGARGITAVFARQLAAASRCRLELAGRTQLAAGTARRRARGGARCGRAAGGTGPPGMRKPAEIEQAARDILARREVEATIAELQALGSRVRYHCADAGDEEAISQVLKLARQEHGRIDGVVYAAGIIEDRLIADKNPESFTRVFRTKVAGAQIVLETLAEQQCDPGFVVLYGSVAAAFGSRGQADYAAGQRCARDHRGRLGLGHRPALPHRPLGAVGTGWRPPGHGQPGAGPGVPPPRDRHDRPRAGRGQPAARAGLGRSRAHRHHLHRDGARCGLAGPRPARAGCDERRAGRAGRHRGHGRDPARRRLAGGATGATWPAASMPSPTPRRCAGIRSITTRPPTRGRTACTASVAASSTTSPGSTPCSTASCPPRSPGPSRSSSSRCRWPATPSRTRAGWAGSDPWTGWGSSWAAAATAG